jgi:hypothetical protein
LWLVAREKLQLDLVFELEIAAVLHADIYTQMVISV